MKRPIAYTFLLSLVLLHPFSSVAADRAVDNNFHGWFNYFGDHPLGKSKWSVHLEGQFRRHELILSWQQLLLRPAINYDVNKTLTLTAGYANARSYSYSDLSPASPATTEHRLWEQALVRYRVQKAALTTRLRLEQRFLGSSNPATPGYRYENRFRAWEQITLPLRGKMYFTAYDEIWFYIKPYVSKSVFDQNRAYAAAGFRVKPSVRVEVGYMNQAVFQRSGLVHESNHTFMLSVFSNKNFSFR